MSKHRVTPSTVSGSTRSALLCGLLGLIAVAAGILPACASAQPPAASHLEMRVIPLPSHFNPADGTDGYELLLTDTGAAPAAASPEEPLILRAMGLSDLEVQQMQNGKEWGGLREELECNAEPGVCLVKNPVLPDESVRVHVQAAPTATTGIAKGLFTAEQGGTVLLSQATDTPISSTPSPFGIESFQFDPTSPAGTTATQAGAHPYEQITSFELPSDELKGQVEELYRPALNPRTVSVTLPPGFAGNPLAAAQCPTAALEDRRSENEELVPPCPRDSKIGIVTLVTGRAGGATTTQNGEANISAVYNLTPEGDHPAEFGFSYAGFSVVFYADVVYSEGAYRLRVSAPAAPIVALDGAIITLFGNPLARAGSPVPAPAFLTNPSSCSATPVKARIEANSWEEPHSWQTAETAAYPALEGCDQLNFSPQIAVRPGAGSSSGAVEAEAPSGYEVALKVPRAETLWAELSSPQAKDVTLNFPSGLTVSPSSANGLEGCAATGPQGIDLAHGGLHPNEAGEGEEIGVDGLSHLSPGHCPPGSVLGSVEVKAPALEQPLLGHLYLGTPNCSPCSNADAADGNLIKLYIEVAGSGIVVKLPGTGTLDPATGQISATFKDNPQFPFEELKVQMRSGPTAPLANPATCGKYQTTSDIVPWSTPETATAAPTSTFDVNSGSGGPCPTSLPNKPSFEAGTLTPIAGSYSPFLLKLSRADGTQRIGSIDTTLPPGLVGKLAGVPYCSPAAIAAAAQKSGAAEQASPSCPLASEVGTVNVGAGPGTSPYYVKGHTYLAGPYKGAPLSLAIVTPAVAGPFDLGNVVVRTALYVNETTAQIHAVSDPLPTMLAGIPLDIRSVALNMNKPNFTLNPTSCDPMQVLGSATSTLGNVAPLADHFQVGACGALGFAPKLAVNLKGGTKRNKNPALTATVTYPKGSYANIARAQVTLPHSEFLDQSHIGTVCTRVQFAAKACPAASVYGHATATTPLLDKPLSGPVYLRSSSHKLPDLVAELNGQIEVTLAGKVDTGKGGGIRNTFELVPDAPVSKFVLSMQGGKKGLLVNSENICSHTQRALAHFVAQNGKVDNFNPVISNSCRRKKSKSKKASKRLGTSHR